jgi:hypothetical protein
MLCYMLSLAREGQQWHQYHQNELSHFTRVEKNNMALEFHVLALDRHKYVAVLNWLMGSPFGNWILRDNTNIIKQTKNCTDSLH